MCFSGKRLFVVPVLNLIIAVAGLFSPVPPAFAGDIVVIVNEDNNASEISLYDLRMMYEGNKKKWPHGERITVFLPPEGSEEMHALSAQVFKYSSDEEIKKYYLMAIFQQKISAIPTSVFNTQDAVRRVSNDRGGLAVVKESEMAQAKGVRVIRVSGL